MKAGNYLWELPALWINLSRSHDRFEHFTNKVGPWLAGGYPLRIEAVDGKSLDPLECLAWKRWNRLAMRQEMGFKPPSRRQDGVPKPTTIERAQGLRGCELSHRNALRVGVEAGWERFLVLEDDVTFRWELWNVEVPHAEVIFWGGLSRSNHERDAELDARSHLWKNLRKTRQLHATHAYEVTRSAAIHLLSSLNDSDRHIDMGGIWPTVNEFCSVLSIPQIITTERFRFASLTRGGQTIRRRKLQ